MEHLVNVPPLPLFQSLFSAWATTVVVRVYHFCGLDHYYACRVRDCLHSLHAQVHYSPFLTTGFVVLSLLQKVIPPVVNVTFEFNIA